MITLLCLPNEIIAIILGYSDVTIEDTINFRYTCKRFHTAANNKKFREKKYYQRWPSAKKLYDEIKLKENELKETKENVQKNKRSFKLNFVKTGINCSRQLRNYMSQIIFESYYDNELNEYNYIVLINELTHFKDEEHLKEFLIKFRRSLNIYEKIDKNIIKCVFYIDEIRHLLTQFPRKTDCNLTEGIHNRTLLENISHNSIEEEHSTYWKICRSLIEKYCNIEECHFIKLRSLKNMWDKFITQHDRERLLEWAAFYLAQYIQPSKNICFSHVKVSLDSIAQEVLNYLRENHPNHSIFSTSAEKFSYWKNNNIDDNHWNEVESTQIMDTLQEYIKLNFRRYNLTNTNLKNMCIDNVLLHKCGHEMILTIIYHSVARRLGLRCDIINLDETQIDHRYSIFWKPKYVTNNLENARCFNIRFKKCSDVFVDQLSLYRTSFYSKAWHANSRTVALDAIQMRNTMRSSIKLLKYRYILYKKIMPISLI